MYFNRMKAVPSLLFLALFQLSIYLALSDLASIGAVAQSAKCLACPPEGQTGDFRCKLSSKNGVINPISNCSTCGCQKCPDGNKYANVVKDYCSASPSTNCRSKPTCRIACPNDQRCDTLPFDDDLDPNAISCLCACQKCPDGKIYKTGDYLNDQALTSEEIKQCPNVLYPIQPIQNLC